MRRMVRRIPLLVIPVLLIAGALPAGAEARAKLVTSFASEPPDQSARNGQFRASVTIGNQGTTTAGANRINFYLSLGRRFSQDDLGRRVTATPSRQANFGRLRARRETSRRVTLRLPATLADGLYYLVTCLGTARVNSDNLNCHFSGQQVRIGPGPTVPPVAQTGVPASGSTFIRVPRVTLDTGFANINDGERAPHTLPSNLTADVAAREGSTQRIVLAQVGPLTFEGICREGMPGEPFNDSERGNDEAKILVSHNATGETMIHRGIHGSHGNIPPGMGQAGAEGALGGEGQHQILATFRPEENEGFSVREADNSIVNNNGPTHEFVATMIAGSAYIALSGGTEVMFAGYAGIDVLGQGTPDNQQSNYPDDDENDKSGEDDRCVFGGGITVVNP